MTGWAGGRLRALWDCRPRRAVPPRTVTDGWGRRWALWVDGRWVDPARLPAGTRVDLLDRLNGWTPGGTRGPW